MDILLIAAGLAGLLAGGELLVRGAVALARSLGVSPLVIGLTLVGFGTSAPELVTSLQAAFAGSPGIALGNVVGSNIANILLILGIAAAITPLASSRAAFRRDGSVLVLASLALTVVIVGGGLGRVEGALLLAGLAGFLAWVFVAERRGATPAGEVYIDEADEIATPPTPPARSALTLLFGLVLTVVAARLLVDGAIGVSRSFGVSETVIGLTVVAVGTSMPELVTSVVAARRGHGDVAFGNIVGSNIFNILGILGVTGLARPLAVPADIAGADIWIMLAATAALVVFSISGWRVTRGEGWTLLGGYAAYLAFMLHRAV